MCMVECKVFDIHLVDNAYYLMGHTSKNMDVMVPLSQVPSCGLEFNLQPRYLGKFMEYDIFCSYSNKPRSIIGVQDDSFVLVESKEKNSKQIIIPDFVQIIGKNAIHDNHVVEEIFIPESCVDIKKHAVVRCSSLKKILMPCYLMTSKDDLRVSCDSVETYV